MTEIIGVSMLHKRFKNFRFKSKLSFQILICINSFNHITSFKGLVIDTASAKRAFDLVFWKREAKNGDYVFEDER